jgi:hypothetical protein
MDENLRADTRASGRLDIVVDNKIVVLSPIEGTPAYRLASAGDKIVVDGKPPRRASSPTTCSSC